MKRAFSQSSQAQGRFFQFREKFPSALAHAKSEVLLYEVDDAGDVGTTPTRTCYAPHSGANGARLQRLAFIFTYTGLFRLVRHLRSHL